MVICWNYKAHHHCKSRNSSKLVQRGKNFLALPSAPAPSPSLTHTGQLLTSLTTARLLRVAVSRNQSARKRSLRHYWR